MASESSKSRKARDYSKYQEFMLESGSDTRSDMTTDNSDQDDEELNEHLMVIILNDL